jgi:hypothetical protein
MCWQDDKSAKLKMLPLTNLGHILSNNRIIIAIDLWADNIKTVKLYVPPVIIKRNNSNNNNSFGTLEVTIMPIP